MTTPILPDLAAPVNVPTNGRRVRCPQDGPLADVSAVPYTRPGGVPALHLRAACPHCGAWAQINGGPWFIPRNLAGLETRRTGTGAA